MQRKHLKVGDVLFYQRTKWSEAGKAKVVAVEPYARVRGGAVEFAPDTTPGATGVLVELTEPLRQGNWTEPRRTIVAVRNLHGPYDEVKAQRNAEAQAKREKADAARQRRTAVHEAANAAVDRARGLGLASALNATGAYEENPARARVSISVADFTRLLDTIKGLRQEVANWEAAADAVSPGSGN